MFESSIEPTDDVINWIRVVEPDLVQDALRLRRIIDLLDRYQQQRWTRHVSAGDAISDRWELGRRLGFGDGTSVYDSALVIGDVQAGHNTWIGPSTVLDGSGGLTIGDWCSISAGVQIYSHDSVMQSISGGEASITRAASSIGSNVYVGPNAVIGAGVSIGSRSIIGAASLVNRDIPAGSVAFGIPAKVVESVDDYIARRTSRP